MVNAARERNYWNRAEPPRTGPPEPLIDVTLRNPGEHTSVGLHLYVEDVDAQYQRALDAGATSLSEPKDQFYGDRSASVTDPFGHLWFLATREKDLTEERIRQRAEEMFKQG